MVRVGGIAAEPREGPLCLRSQFLFGYFFSDIVLVIDTSTDTVVAEVTDQVGGAGSAACPGSLSCLHLSDHPSDFCPEK